MLFVREHVPAPVTTCPFVFTTNAEISVDSPKHSLNTLRMLVESFDALLPTTTRASVTTHDRHVTLRAIAGTLQPILEARTTKDFLATHGDPRTPSNTFAQHALEHHGVCVRVHELVHAHTKGYFFDRDIARYFTKVVACWHRTPHVAWDALWCRRLHRWLKNG